MHDEKIRISSTDSVNGVSKNNNVVVPLKHHTKTMPFLSVFDTIDQMELFEKERDNCTKYRLIVTINPFCSNILFNAVTEIVQNEGSSEEDKLVIAHAEGINPIIDDYDIKGKRIGVTNTDMVRNTEYSNGTNPFVYHCGYDIFNNHLLRNTTFKVVNPYNGNYSHKDEFNTIRDFHRYGDGKEVELSRRTDVNTISNPTSKHLYIKEDILSFVDSINTNLTEKNGWFGFHNRATVPSCEKGGEWEKVAKVFNDEETIGCGFIEMYPDSTLYSFNPKFNKLQNREEHNWDVCLTYPYENDDSVDRVLINGTMKGDNTVLNALLLASCTFEISPSGQDIVLCRSYVKHNLQPGDTIKLYYSPILYNSDESNFIEIPYKLFTVTDIGNLDGKYKDYYFYFSEQSYVEEELRDYLKSEPGFTGVIDPNKMFNFRFKKVVNNRECKYYYRKFKKIPNLKFKREELTDEIVYDKTKFNDYITNNCTIDGKMRLFNREQYPLAFSNTVYGDSITQMVFTDSIDIDKLKDNHGRPLTELYFTIIKRNKGHNLWYNTKKTEEDLKTIEFSHCFGELLSGLTIHSEGGDRFNGRLKRNKLLLGDVCSLTTKRDIDTENNMEVCYALDENIDIDTTNEFYGDVVELDTYSLTETSLSDVCFRFNTEQREHNFNISPVYVNKEDGKEISKEKYDALGRRQSDYYLKYLKCGNFIYDEITSDDYDFYGFQCQEYDADEQNDNNLTTYRPEGYYYKAHYKIPLREFGRKQQASHRQIWLKDCNIRQSGGLYIEIVSKTRVDLNVGSILYLYDNEQHNKIAELKVQSKLSNVRYLITAMKYDKERYLDIYKIVSGLLYTERQTKSATKYVNVFDDEITIDLERYENLKEEEQEKYVCSELGDRWVDKDGIEHYADKTGVTVKDYSNPTYVLRIKNYSIPEYAVEVDNNIYLWRDVLGVGNSENISLKEYPFANGHFYINEEINFYLRRQDPIGYLGLLSNNIIPNDISGSSRSETEPNSIYQYKQETENKC